jgi:hypothetical protein
MMDMYISGTQFYHTKELQSAMNNVKFLNKTKQNVLSTGFQRSVIKWTINDNSVTNYLYN